MYKRHNCKIGKAILLIVLSILFSRTLIAQTKKIMPLGNSITWGKIDQAAPPPGEHGYRNHLLDNLSGYDVELTGPHGTWGTSNLPGDVADPPYLGYYVDGARIDEILPDSAYSVSDMLDGLAVSDLPDIVLIHLGTNDLSTYQHVGNYNTPGTITHEMKMLVNYLLGYSRHTIEQIFLCKIIPAAPYTEMASINARIVEYNSKIQELWEQLDTDDQSRVTLVNMNAPFYANQMTYYNVDADPTTDNDHTHPNENGYEAMGEVFADYIKNYLAEPLVDYFDRTGTFNGNHGWHASNDSIRFRNVGENGGGAIYCTAKLPETWSNMALWDSTQGLNTFEIKIHSQSTTDIDTLSGVGLLVGMNSTDFNTVHGYLVILRRGNIRVFDIYNGNIVREVGYRAIGLNLGRNATFGVTHVVVTTATQSINRFYVSLNNNDFSPIEDPYGYPYNANARAGVMFRGAMGTSVLVDHFKADIQRKDVVAPGQIDNLQAISPRDNSVTLLWTSVGDDGVDGQAASYDLRYSMNNITNSNFDEAKIVADVPPPKTSGQSESYTVTGLLPNTRYFFAIKAVDSWGNTGSLSTIANETTTGKPYTDSFDRTSLGEDWVCNPIDHPTEYQITNGELVNTELTRNWGGMAIYKRANPHTVRMAWGQAVTNPVSGVENGGIVVLADDTTTTASGYLVFVRTTSRLIYLFDIVNGEITDLIDAVSYNYDNVGYYPSANDTLSVVINTSNPTNNKFDVYVNRELATRNSLYDMDKLHGNEDRNYSGIILARLSGDRNNNVDAFITYGAEGSASQISAVGSQTLEGTVNQWLPDSIKVVVRTEDNIPKANIPVTFVVTQGDGEITAPQPPDDHIRIEAEWGNPQGTMVMADDDEAAGGKYILSYSSGNHDGWATYPFYVQTSGKYYFWGRAKSSYWHYFVIFFELVGKTAVNGFAWNPHYSTGSSTWRWDAIRVQGSSTPFSADLTAGQVYTIKIWNGHPELPLDKLIVTKDAGFVPNGKEEVDMLYTNGSGEAGTTWKLAQTAGINRVVARTYSVAQPVEFVATGLADTVRTIQKLTDDLTGVAGDTLGTRLKVALFDKYENKARAGTSVTFQVIEGAGELTDPNAVTNANGEASTNILLGYQYTLHKIRATFFDRGMSGQVVFTVQTTAGAVKKLISKTSVPDVTKHHFVNSSYPNFLATQAFNDQNQPVQNVAITFQIVSGDGHVGVQPKYTNNLGIAEDTLWTGPTAGLMKVIARCGAIMDTVVVDSIFYKGVSTLLVGGNEQRVNVSSTSGKALEVVVYDKDEALIYNYPVTFKIASPSHGFKFPDGSTTLVVYTSSTTGKASTFIVAGSVHGYYKDIVTATTTNGFKIIGADKFSFKVQSEANSIVKKQGDLGTGVVGDVLSEPLKVQMLSRIGKPVAGQPVIFRKIKGNNGYFWPSKLPVDTVYTSEDSGYAMIYYQLGSESGYLNNKVVAYTKNMGTDSISTVFQLSAKSSKADSIAAVDGANLLGVVGKPLSAPIEVRLYDDQGNIVSSDSVEFSITSTTGGTLDTLNATIKSADTTKIAKVNSATGKASLIWTLGKKVGTLNNILKATANDGIQSLKGSPLLFYASAQADSVSPTESTIAATGPVYATGNDTSWITVVLCDQYKNPIVNKKVTLSVTGEGLNLCPPPPNTDENGRTTGYLVSTASGWKTITASAQGITLLNEAKVRFMSNGAKDINYVSGDKQIGNVNTVLKDSLVVEVVDQYNNPVADAPVTFSVFSGGGTIIEQDNISNENGLAYAKYVLGSNPGQNLVKVTSDVIQNAVYFSATSRNKGAVSMYWVSGSPQIQSAGEILAKPFVVAVEDEDHYPVANVDITFQNKTSYGKLETASPAKTNEYGQTNVWFRVDTLANRTSTIEAKNENLAGWPVTFLATSVSGAARRMVKEESSDNQTGWIGGATPNPLIVYITDRYGNSVSGKLVKFKVLDDGDAKVQGGISAAVVSNSLGMASVPVTLGYTTGVIRIEASTSNPPLEGSPLIFTITAKTADNTLAISKFAGDNQKGTVGHPLALPLCVKVVDSKNNPATGRPIYFLESGNGSIIETSQVSTNSKGLALVHYQVGLIPGTEEVRAIVGGNEVRFTIYAVSNTNIPVLNKDIIDPSYAIVEKADSPLRIPLIAEDPDISSGDTLRFQHGDVDPPAGASIYKQSASIAALLWTPDWDQEGDHTLILQVVDTKGGFDEASVVVNVINNDRPPQILGRHPAGDTTLTSGQTVPFWIAAWDPDSDPLTYRWMVNGKDVSCPYAQFYYSIDKENTGNETIIASVSDGEAITTTTWVLNVTSSVELVDFNAQFVKDLLEVKVNWATASETDNLGFHVYRSFSDEGKYEKINEKIIPSSKEGEYTFVDKGIEVGRTYYYKLIDVDIRGNEKEHGPVMIQIPRPEKYALSQNYPNPFNPSTIIQYEVPKREHILLIIYNMMGQRVVTLVDKVTDPGYYTIQWNGKNELGNDISTGIYIYRLSSPSKVLTHKMIKMK